MYADEEDHGNLWQDPPSFKTHLTINVWISFVLSTLILVAGIILLYDPLMPIRDHIAQIPQAHDDACHFDHVDVCPTVKTLHLENHETGGWLFFLTSFIIGTSLLDLFICLVVGMSLQKDNKQMLFISLALIPLAMGLEWKLVDLAFYVNTPIHEWGKDELTDLYNDHYHITWVAGSSHFTKIYNTIMMAYECCGFRSPNDTTFEEVKIVWLEKSSALLYRQPPACCVTNLTTMDNHAPIMFTKDNHCFSYDALVWPMHSEGCFEKVFNEIYETYGVAFVTCILLTIMSQSSQSILSVFVLLKRKEIKRKSSARSSSMCSAATASRTVSRRTLKVGFPTSDPASTLIE